ncbi:hypothetical protein Ancab_006604 [Ancistrocladus abbreviatus]
MSGAGKVVCVTEAAGYIASWTVKLLLQRGYSVRGTVRDPADRKKTEHLLRLDGAEERLKLFRADLLEEGSFDSVVDGCDGVFHMASPISFKGIKDPKAELITPAVKGTRNVLKSCAKAKSIRRVVLTSSMAAVVFTGQLANADVLVDEAWFSVPSVCEELELWYPLSKTLAEKAAWKFAKENGLDLVTTNAGYIFGPPLQPTINVSVGIILDLFKGPTYPNGYVMYVDVRDVANAHIQAFEIALASGRHCLVDSSPHFSDIIKILRESFPNLKLAEKCVDAKHDELWPTLNVSKEKAKNLGIKFTPLEVSLKDTVECLKEMNYIS